MVIDCCGYSLTLIRGISACGRKSRALNSGLPDNLNGTLYQSIGDALVHKAMQLAGDGVREDEEAGVS